MNNSKYKILIVDDAKENLSIVSNILNDVGYLTQTANDGLGALRYVKENHYDLILLDVMMPIMGGIETCRFLKVEPKSASIPVISMLPLFETASIVCMQHHEKYDGSGYPKELKVEDIHIYGRIVSIANVFDALSFKRAYKDEWKKF